jgi:phospholipid/cholesterol/gamma-HCH transport system substrate-binding protein
MCQAASGLNGVTLVSRSLSRLQAILLGAVVLVTLALAGAGLFALGSRHWPWNDTFDVQVGFRQARGVEVGTRVRVQGVNAGEVVEVRLPARTGRDVMLTLRLDGKWRRQQLIRADATARIVSDSMVGGKVIEIDPGTEAAEPVRDHAVLAAAPSADLADTVAQVGSLLQSESGKVSAVVEKTDRLIQKSTETVESLSQIADGLKDVWGLRSLVKDPQKLLFPPGCEANPWWFKEAELFDPGTDRLTASGRQRLDSLAPQLAGLTRHSGAKMVVLAYADPRANDAGARTLTRNQAEVVYQHLKNGGAVHKDYGVWSREATALGLGAERPPTVVKDKPPPPGPAVGLVVFVPQK